MLARRRAAVVLLCATLIAAASSCAKAPINRTGYSGSATASTVNGVQQVTLTTGDDYRFHPSTFTVHPGRVEVILHNTGTGAPHDFEVTGFPADFVPLTPAGQTQLATFTAPPVLKGTSTKYQFQCTIHLRQGQVGSMIVTPG